MLNRLAAFGLLIISLISATHLAAQPPAGRGTADEPAGKRVYVPLEDLDVILDQDKQGVILPRAEFVKLAAEAKKQLEDTPVSPLPVVVSQAQYTARTQDNQLAISAVIELNQLARGWQTVTLPFTGLAVESATLDDKPAEIGRAPGEGRPLVVFTRQSGKHTLKLELSTALVMVGSDQAAGFGLAPISSASLQISLPAGKHLHVDEVPLNRPGADDQPATYTVALGGKSTVSLRITDRRTQQGAASLVFASTAIGLHVAPEERTWRAITSLSVFGKPIDNLTFVIPKSLDIISVESTGLERWEIGEGAGGNTTTLKLVYRQPFDESRTVTFSGVSASVLGQSWSVPTLSLASATSHLVGVLVQHPAGLRLQQVEATGVRRISSDEAAQPDAASAPELAIKVGAGQMLHYAAWRESFSLLFVTQPRARELQATIATRVDIMSHEISLRASIAVQSRFAPLFDFDLALPVDWSVTDVLVENRPVAWRVVPVAAGLNQVRVAFNPPIPADGKVNLILAARIIPGENWPIEDKTLAFNFPEVTLPQVGVTDGRYMIAADDDLDLVPEEVSGLDPARLTPEEQRAPSAPRLVYEYQDTKFTGTLKVTRKPVHVASQTLAYHRLDRETLLSHLEARMVVQGGGLQKLQIALPAVAGTNLRFSLIDPPHAPQVRLPQITEQTSAAPADGERVWTLQLDQRAFGLLWLVVDLTSPRSVETTTFTLPGLRVVSAERQNGFVAVEAGPDQQLDVAAIDAAGQPLAEVDPADVPVPQNYAPHERIVAAYRAVRPGFRVTLKETRFEKQPVPTAICDKASLTSVLGEGGEQQHKAEFTLRAVGVQSLRIELPSEASLWATLVDGRPVEVRVLKAGVGGAAAYSVPLPPASGPDQPHAVQLFYRTTGDSLAGSGTLRQKPPKIEAISGQGTTQPIDILDQEWLLYYPSQTEITSSSGQFDPVERPARISLLGWLHESLSQASPRDLWQKAIVAAIVATVTFVVFFAYRRRGVTGAAITVAIGLVLAVISIFFTFANQEKSSSEYYIGATNARPNAEAAIDISRAENKYWEEERFGKAPVRDPVDGDSGMIAGMGGRGMAGGKPGMPGGMGGGMGGAGPGMGAPGMPPMAATQPAAASEMTALDLAPPSVVNGPHAAPGSSDLPQSNLTEKQQRNAFDKLKRESSAEEMLGVEGGDVAFRPKPSKSGRASGSGGRVGAQLLMADGSVRHVAKDLAFQVPDTRDIRDGTSTSVAVGEAGGFRLNVNGGGLKGALLSLAIDIPITPGSRQTAFKYTGEPAAGTEPTLEVEYQNRRALSFVSFAWQAGVLLVFWFARKWSAGVRGALAVIGLIGPLALVSLVPIDVLPYLDGLFLGTVWGLALWFALAIITIVRKSQSTSNSKATPTHAALLLTIACGFATVPAMAQDAKPQATSQARSKEHATSIIVPYEPGSDPLQAARVFLPWEKFLELWNAAHPDQIVEQPAPHDGFVAEALYSVQLSPPAAGKKPLADVTGRFVLHSLLEDQVTIALPFGRVALERAQLDGKPAAIVSRDNDAGSEMAVVISTRGVHVLDVKFSVPFEQTSVAGKFTLTTKPVPAGSLRLTLPADDLNLRVSGGATTYRKAREQDRSIAIVPVDQGGDITVAWSPAKVREAAQGIVHVESQTAVSLGDAGLRIASNFSYTVRQGAISEVAFSLPSGLLVRQIAGLDLGGWEIAGEGAERTLKVFLRRPVSDATAVQFDLFVPQSFTEQVQPVQVPQLVPQGITRETGTLGITAERQLTMTAGTASGLAQIDLAQFIAPAPIRHSTDAATKPAAAAPQLAYRFAARPVQLQLLVARRKPQSKGTAEHAVYVGTRKLRMASRLEMELAGAPRSEINVQLPAGYLLYDLKANDAVDYHVESRPGENNPLLVVELSAPRTGMIELLLDGIVPRAPEDVAPRIAVPMPLEIGELRTSLAIWLDRIYTGTLEDLTGWKSVDPTEVSLRLRMAHSSPVQFAFTSTLTGLQPVGLTLHRAVPRLSADGLSVVIARDTSVQYLLYLRWNIAAAGESTFVFTTPDWLADRLEFDRSAGGIRIRQVLSEKIAGNRLRWTVTLEDPRTVVSTLLAQATLPPPESGRIAAPTVIFEQSVAAENGRQFQPLDQQHQFVVLVNQSPQRLDQEVPDAVEAITAVDLPIKISQTISDQAAEILRIRDARAAIGWKLQAGQQLKSLSASVNLAKMTLVLARDGSWRGAAQYRINNRSRQFLGLRMPDGVHVLSLFVGDQPSRPINPKRAGEPNLILVPLPKTAAGDLSVEVKLVFAGRFDRPLPKGMQILRSEIDLPSPQVLSQTDDPQYGIPVAATEWTVVLPPDVDVQPVDDATKTNLVQSVAGGEQVIAEYNELLNLYQLLRDESQLSSVRTRASNNLKQLEAKVANDSNSIRVDAGVDNRQGRELQELQGKWQQAQQQLQAPARGAKGVDASGLGNPVVSNIIIQRELITGNSADFQLGENSPDDDSDDVLSLTVKAPASEKSAAKAGSKSGKQSGANRRELRQQTASQSATLNETAVADGITVNKKLPSRADANAVDAEEVLEEANTEGMNQSLAARRSKFKKTGQLGREQGQPQFDDIAGGLLPDGRTTTFGNLGGRRESILSGGIPPGGTIPPPGRDGLRYSQPLLAGSGTDFGRISGPIAAGGGGASQSALWPGKHSLVPNAMGAFDSTADKDEGFGISAWTAVGGLSLDITVPQEGQKLTFSKSGGDARLALGVRPRASLEVGFGLVWAIVWSLVGLGLIATLGRADALAALVRRLPLLAIGVGLAWYFLLPAAALGFMIFVVGAVSLGWQHRRG